MGLSVYLNGPAVTRQTVCHCCGHESETTEPEELYHANITHNLCSMARALGIHKVLWYPEEVGVNLASDLIAPLEKAKLELTTNRKEYLKYEAPNGWGTLAGFLRFIAKLLDACKEHPEARYEISR